MSLVHVQSREDAQRALRWATALSLGVHVLGLSALAWLSGQVDRGPLTDVSAQTTLVFRDWTPPPDLTPQPPTQDEPPPPPEPLPQPPQEQPAESLVPPEPAPPPPEDARVAEAPRDPTFGTPTPPAQPREQPVADIPQPARPAWQPAPAPPPPPEPKASFAGVEASPARRIVYLIDGSGSMAAALNFVKTELAASVARLNVQQRFQIIVYRQPTGGGTPALTYYTSPDNGFIAATLDAKEGVRAWLETIGPSGRSEPLVGIEAAMRLQPDLIFVLTRNIARTGGVDFEQRNREVLNVLDRINPPHGGGGRPARIKTIQFLEDDPTGLMQAIAQSHGQDEGSYRLVTRAEVNETRKGAGPPAADPSKPLAPATGGS